MIEEWMAEARMVAAQCWCDDATKHRVMDPALAEAVARRIAAWMETAMQAERNAAFYREILDRCAANLGLLAPLAFVADDGSITDAPLRLKIPALVAMLAQGYVPPAAGPEQKEA